MSLTQEQLWRRVDAVIRARREQTATPWRFGSEATQHDPAELDALFGPAHEEPHSNPFRLRLGR